MIRQEATFAKDFGGRILSPWRIKFHTGVLSAELVAHQPPGSPLLPPWDRILAVIDSALKDMPMQH